MDQDSFRQLLSSSNLNGRTGISTAAVAQIQKPTKTKSKKGETSEPSFKPRTVKKASTKDSSYRDRAAERRLGKESDYAQIEALAEDFERRAAEEETEKATIEEQRKYLGGDGDHSVLVKGLDFALLEANKARAVVSSVDDDTLEEAFMEGSSSTVLTVGKKKRTREDIIRDLKNKRPKTDDDGVKNIPIEDVKKSGKFKPIGFRPIGSSVDEGKLKKVKKAKGDGKDGGKKKKKGGIDENPHKHGRSILTLDKDVKTKAGPSALANPEPEVVQEDFDIFADAGEYTGLELDEEENEEAAARSDSEGTSHVSPPVKANWFSTEEEGEVPPPPPDNPGSKSTSPPQRQASGHESEEGEAEEEASIRLVPLASSSVPSIKDILAMDDAAQKEQKRKARKEKKKSTLGAEGKADRDYQRLKSYTEKKAAAT